MQIGLAALDTTDWSKLYHAYGRATDTPDHLRAFWENDGERHKAALSHLWSAVIHQGTPWTATGPAALVVAGLVVAQGIDQDIRANVLSFLIAVAEAASPPGHSTQELEKLAAYDIDTLVASEDDNAIFEDDAATNAFYARSVLACAGVAPTLMEVMEISLHDADPRVRSRAAAAAVALVKTEVLSIRLKDTEATLISIARCAENDDERSAHVLALGDLGYAPLEFLNDPSRAVRVCAAMASACAESSAATAELADAVNHHARSIDSWFSDRPPQFAMKPRFYVVKRAIERVNDFSQLATGALALTEITAKYCVDHDWGPLLAAAFPDGSGIVRTESQRKFLSALVGRPDLWDIGNAIKWFKKAGLLYDREDCARRLEGL